MDTPHEPADRPVRSPKRKAKFVMGTGALMLVFLGLMVWATTRQGATSFYMTTSELVAEGPSDIGATYRVNGKVVPGSIVAAGLDTTFTLSDGTTEVVVTTDRPVPDTFREHSDVVARGRFDGTRFVADEVLAKCPSKFKARA
jgi:cytochrome c-type biogenesis protein CcmE